MKHTLDTRTVRTLPMALTAPPPRPRDMPVQEIVLWTPRRAAVALLHAVADIFAKPVREPVRDEA